MYYPVPAKFYQGQLTGSDAALFTMDAAPTSGAAPIGIVKEIVLTNTDTSARTVTLNIRTGAAAASNQFLSAVSIAANTTTVLTLRTVLVAGEIISGLCDTNAKVNVRISGVKLLTVGTA
jgi:hypothetical protein